jgi:hypothetical protein
MAENPVLNTISACTETLSSDLLGFSCGQNYIVFPKCMNLALELEKAYRRWVGCEQLRQQTGYFQHNQLYYFHLDLDIMIN